MGSYSNFPFLSFWHYMNLSLSLVLLLTLCVNGSEDFLLLELHFPPEYSENISACLGCHED